MRLQKFTKLKNIENLSKLIFLDFINYADAGITIFNYDFIKYNLSQPDLLGWFLLDDEQNIVGYLIGNTKRITDGRYVFFMNYINISDEYKGYGLSNKLLEIAIKEAKDLNIFFIMTICEKNNFNTYKNYGFIVDPIEKIDNDNFILTTLYL